MASNSTKHIVIIGAAYTGAGVAHQLLKLPNVKVTLINPSSTFYFNIGAPRVLAKPADYPASKVLVPITNAFASYSAEKFEFVLGAVTSIDIPGKSVVVGPSRSISYDYLVIASGSTTPSSVEANGIPFKPTSGDDLEADIQRAQKQIANAKSVVIAGAGPVGIETAGEIAEAYPKTSVTLVSATAQILPSLKPSSAARAESNLRSLGVEILNSTKVVGAEKTAEGWNVKLESGKTLKTDLYISAAGVIPNSSFVPPQYLDADGWVKVDSANKVEGVQDGSVFALGDVTTHKLRYMMKALEQIPIVVANIKAGISGSATQQYKPSTSLMAFVPTGSKSGTGQVGSWGVLSFLVAAVKGKDFFISKASSYIAAK